MRKNPKKTPLRSVPVSRGCDVHGMHATSWEADICWRDRLAERASRRVPLAAGDMQEDTDGRTERPEPGA